MPIRVTVWNEFRHEKIHDGVKAIYPDGIHKVIADALNKNTGIKASTATLDEPQNGLTDKILAKTDVLIWWGHMAHDDVNDIIAKKVKEAVLNGMGLIVLHSGHFSKPFKLLMGTSCNLKWREANEKERLWITSPNHPITEGLNEYIELPEEEMYGEFFDIPAPDELIFTSWFQGGEVFRSGCTFHRGHGKIFYFRPGHETHPTYHNSEIQKVIANATRWAAPIKSPTPRAFGNRQPLENLNKK
jgi:trehalose utilization protein